MRVSRGDPTPPSDPVGLRDGVRQVHKGLKTPHAVAQLAARAHLRQRARLASRPTTVVTAFVVVDDELDPRRLGGAQGTNVGLLGEVEDDVRSSEAAGGQPPR